MTKHPPTSGLNQHFWKVALLDAFVLVALAIDWAVARSSSGDTGIALGTVFMVGFIFVSLPLMSGVVLLAVLRSSERGWSASTWAIGYAVISLLGHIALAYSGGFFDKVIDQRDRDRYQRQNPELVELRRAIGPGPRSDISRVKRALDQGASPDASLNRGIMLPVLVVAGSRADLPLLQVLLSAGANPDARGEPAIASLAQPSALDVVAFSEFGDVQQSIDLLLRNGASVRGSALLDGSCWLGDIELYRRVKDLGGSHGTNLNDNNCLHLAAMAERLEFITELLNDAGLQEELRIMLTQKNQYGLIPMDILMREKAGLAASNQEQLIQLQALAAAIISSAAMAPASTPNQ